LRAGLPSSRPFERFRSGVASTDQEQRFAELVAGHRVVGAESFGGGEGFGGRRVAAALQLHQPEQHGFGTGVLALFFDFLFDVISDVISDVIFELFKNFVE